MSNIEKEKILKKCDEYKKDIINLVNSGSYTTDEIIKTPHQFFKIKGVYLISTPDDDEIVYIGKTKTKTIAGRIEDHRSIGTDSNLRRMLELYPKYPKEIKEYHIRCKEIKNERERTFFKYFAIGILQPHFNK